MENANEKKYYVTRKELTRLEREYELLKEFRLAKTRGGEAPEILHSEDLNPEYLAFREDMSFLENKIGELEAVLKNSTVITMPPKTRQGIVDVGACVMVSIDGTEEDEFRIVGTLEANPALGKISNESPVGRALIGRKVGESISISSPIETVYTIKHIRYGKA